MFLPWQQKNTGNDSASKVLEVTAGQIGCSGKVQGDERFAVLSDCLDNGANMELAVVIIDDEVTIVYINDKVTDEEYNQFIDMD
ncbi:MAG: hypothetical protein K5752_07860 [Succinivibrionaceae bacterium]|nr:hypothetical protein [Succinivibrionaceae bacterium]